MDDPLYPLHIGRNNTRHRFHAGIRLIWIERISQSTPSAITPTTVHRVIIRQTGNRFLLSVHQIARLWIVAKNHQQIILCIRSQCERFPWIIRYQGDLLRICRPFIDFFQTILAEVNVPPTVGSCSSGKFKARSQLYRLVNNADKRTVTPFSARNSKTGKIPGVDR